MQRINALWQRIRARSLLAIAVALALALAAAACDEPGLREIDTSDASVGIAGHVRGQVRTKSGVPIVGAYVEARQQVVGGSTVLKVEGYSGTDGLYDLELRSQVAPWLVSGSAMLVWEGQSFTFGLEPDSSEPFVASDAVVRNLTLDVTNDPFTFVQLQDAIGDDTPTGDVVVTLVPQGLTIDGTSGSTIVASPTNTPDGWLIRGVPIARYQVTATYAGEALLVSLPLTPQRDYDFQSSVVATFESAGPGIHRLLFEICAPATAAFGCPSAE